MAEGQRNFEGKLCHIHVYGKICDPRFQRYQTAAEYLSAQYHNVEATVEGMYETQFEQKLREIASTHGGAFYGCKMCDPVFYVVTQQQILYFKNEICIMNWLRKNFLYEDRTLQCLYHCVGNKKLALSKSLSGHSFCAISFSFGEISRQTLHLELFSDSCPTLARNFLDLLSKPGFDGHQVHRVKAGAWIQAGDLVDGSGAHSEAAQGGLLADESFERNHDCAGLLGMSSHGPNTNGSQFYITLRELPFLDGKSVVFGRVIQGLRILHIIDRLQMRNERPVDPVQVFSESSASMQCENAEN